MDDTGVRPVCSQEQPVGDGQRAAAAALPPLGGRPCELAHAVTPLEHLPGLVVRALQILRPQRVAGDGGLDPRRLDVDGRREVHLG